MTKDQSLLTFDNSCMTAFTSKRLHLCAFFPSTETRTVQHAVPPGQRRQKGTMLTAIPKAQRLCRNTLWECFGCGVFISSDVLVSRG